MPGLRKVRPGERLQGFSAGAYNQFVDAVDWIRRNKDKVNDRPPPAPRSGCIQVLNEESFGFDQFDIVGLDDILFSYSDNATEFKNNPAFRVTTPAASHQRKFAVLQEPVPSGTNRLVGAVAHGITVARINVSSAAHEFAIVTPGEWTQFASASAGPVAILWKESGTGTSKWAVVCIDGGSASADVVLACRVTNIGSTAIANTVTAETGTISYTATNGRQTLGFTADSPQATIVVHEMSGHGPPPRVGDVLLVVSVDGQYQVVKSNARSRLKAKPNNAISAGSAGTVTVWKNGLATSRTEQAWFNWMEGTTTSISANKEVIIEWFDDEQKWIIVEAEC